MRFLIEFDKKCQKEKRKYERELASGMVPEVIPKYPPKEGG